MTDEPGPTDTETDSGTEPGSVLTRTRALARGVPRRHRIIAAVVAGVVAVTVVAALGWPAGGVGRPDVTVDTDKTVPLLEDLGTQPRPDPADGNTDNDELPHVDQEPKWTYTDAGDSPGLRAVDGGFLVSRDETLVGLDAEGDKIWEKTTDGDVDIGDSAITVSKDVEDDDSWPGRDDTTVLDPGTGEEQWSDSTASFVSTWHDTVYLSKCQGGQDGELGECVVSARDPASGATRWTRPTYASTDVIRADADGSFVVFESHVTGGEDIRYTVVDAATGTVLDGGFDQDGYGGGDVLAVGDVIIQVGYDDNPADDCRIPVTAVNVRSGNQVWDRKLGVEAQDGGEYCGGLRDHYGDRIMAYDGDDMPMVVNLLSGETEWTAPKKGSPQLANGDYALVKQDDGELALYDTGSDKKLWGLADGPGVGDALFTGDHVYIDTDAYFAESNGWIRVGLESGDPRRYPGSNAGRGDDWIAAADEDGGLSLYPVESS